MTSSPTHIPKFYYYYIMVVVKSSPKTSSLSISFNFKRSQNSDTSKIEELGLIQVKEVRIVKLTEAEAYVVVES